MINEFKSQISLLRSLLSVPCSPPTLSPAHPPTIPLLLLIGLPGSGKSSLARNLIRLDPDRRLISTDAVRSQLFGDEAIQGSWLRVEREVEQQFCQTVQQILSGQVSEGVYDATNAVRKQRREAIALARNCGFTHITGLWLRTPLWLCLERNRQRDRQVPEDIILQMYRCLLSAPPSLEESLDCLIQINPQFILKTQRLRRFPLG